MAAHQFSGIDVFPDPVRSIGSHEAFFILGKQGKEGTIAQFAKPASGASCPYKRDFDTCACWGEPQSPRSSLRSELRPFGAFMGYGIPRQACAIASRSARPPPAPVPPRSASPLRSPQSAVVLPPPASSSALVHAILRRPRASQTAPGNRCIIAPFVRPFSRILVSVPASLTPPGGQQRKSPVGIAPAELVLQVS